VPGLRRRPLQQPRVAPLPRPDAGPQRRQGGIPQRLRRRLARDALHDIGEFPAWNLVEDLQSGFTVCVSMPASICRDRKPSYKVTRKTDDLRWHWRATMPQTLIVLSVLVVFL
jgi:hypothetical protein